MGLAASGGVKRGPVQHYFQAVVVGLLVDHLRIEGGTIGI
jgi:hypothetical protein